MLIRWWAPLRGRPFVDVRTLVEVVYQGEFPMDFTSVLASTVEWHPLGTDAATGAATDLGGLVSDPAEVRLALRASAGLPLLAGPAVVLRGRRFFDGGLAEPVPFRTPMAGGATHLVVLRSRPFRVRPADPVISPRPGPRGPALDQHLPATGESRPAERLPRAQRADAGRRDQRGGDGSGRDGAVLLSRPLAGRRSPASPPTGRCWQQPSRRAASRCTACRPSRQQRNDGRRSSLAGTDGGLSLFIKVTDRRGSDTIREDPASDWRTMTTAYGERGHVDRTRGLRGPRS